MKSLNWIILVILILTIFLPVVYADLTEDAIDILQDSYITIIEAEEVGGNVTTAVLMLNHASELISQGGESNLREAIKISNEVKVLAISIQQNSQNSQIFLYSKLFVFLIVSIIFLILIKKYGDRVYYHFWASIKADWRIEKR